jgi:hypothetical protein
MLEAASRGSEDLATGTEGDPGPGDAELAALPPQATSARRRGAEAAAARVLCWRMTHPTASGVPGELAGYSPEKVEKIADRSGAVVRGASAVAQSGTRA